MKKIILLLTIGVALNTQLLLAQVPSYVPSNGLVGYWPFSGNANDQSGNNLNGSVSGASLVADRFGNLGKAYNFSNGNQFITLPAPPVSTFTNSMSYSLWYKEIPNTNYVNIFNTTGNKALVLQPNAAGIRANDGNSFGLDGYSTALNSNGWKHICVVYVGQIISIYINGVLANSGTTGFPNTILYNSTQSIVGSTYLMGGQYPYSGLIDDIALYNRALTQQEITAMYNGVTYSDTCNAVNGSLVNGLVSYYPFCGNANDQSGNGNNGIVNGATLTTDRFGNNNSAYNFDGLSNYIDLNKQLPNTFSISLWVLVDVFKSYSGVNHNNIGGTMIGTFNNNFEFSGFACETSGVPSSFGQHYAAFWNPNPNNVSVTSSNNLVINEWKNLIMTYNGVSLKYYVNGIQEGSSNAIFTQNNRNLFVGARQFHLNGPNFFFDGKIDDIGIWNRALTQTEITQLYNQNQCITNITVTDTLIINVGQLSYTNPVAYANNITIYPNPASTQININFNNITNLVGGSVKVINALGQQVATTPITTTGTNSTMLLSTWGGSGLYFVQILNPQGQIVDIKKILLQ
jgi:hypothetical protein